MGELPRSEAVFWRTPIGDTFTSHFLFLCASSDLRFHHFENGAKVKKLQEEDKRDPDSFDLTFWGRNSVSLCENSRQAGGAKRSARRKTRILKKSKKLKQGPCKRRSLEDPVGLLYTSLAWSEHISRNLFISFNKGSWKYWWKEDCSCLYKYILPLNPWNCCRIHLLCCQTSKTDNFKSTFWNPVICGLI